MKFSVNCNILATQCRKARKYTIKHRRALPILRNILLIANKSCQNLQVISTNTDKFFKSELIPAKVETSGAITIPPRTFIDILATLKNESIDIEVDLKFERLHYKYTSTNFKCSGYINCISAKEFPSLKNREWIIS